MTVLIEMGLFAMIRHRLALGQPRQRVTLTHSTIGAIMQKQFDLTTLVRAILVAIDAGRKALEQYNAAIRAARPALAGKPEDVVRAEIAEIVSAYRKVPLIDGKGKGAGRKVFDRAAPHYESAKLDLRTIVKDILGTSSPDKESKPTKVRLSAAEKDAARALLAACGGDLKRAVAALKAVA
jgi:hypothetical protein